MKKIILLLSVLFLSTPVIAQTPYWHQTNGPEGGTVENITIDSSGNVYVWTAGSGTFRSSDSGTSWHLLNHGLLKAQVYIGAYSTSGYLIAANAPADGQIFRYNVKDPNAQWEEITPYKGVHAVTVNDIAADPNGEIYVAAGNLGILRSDDNGLTWLSKGSLIDSFEITPRLQTDANTFSLSLDGNGNLFAGLAATGAIFRSSDKGETWTKLPTLFDSLHQKQLMTLLVAPNGNIIVGSIQSTLDDPGHIYVSTDTGKTWKAKYQRPATSEEQKNNIDKLIRVPNTNVIYANAHGPTLRSTDFGVTWTVMDTDKRGDEVFSMAAIGNYLFQMCEPDGVFLSTDNGKNWTEKNTGMYAEFMWGVALNSFQHLFAITEYGLWASIDDGNTWVHKPEYGEDYNPSLFIDKHDYIFIGTNKGLFRSHNEGDSLDHVIIHTQDASDTNVDNVIYQVGEDWSGRTFCSSLIDSLNFNYSTDEGDHWIRFPYFENFGSLVNPYRPYKFAFASNDTILLSVIPVGGAGTTSKFYRSVDRGSNWDLLSDQSGIFVAQLLIDPDGSYLARVKGATGGIYRSVDGAKSWIKIFPVEGVLNSFKDYTYMMLTHDANMVVCTDSGVFRSTDPSLSLWYNVSSGLTANDVPDHFVTCAGVAENLKTHNFYAASRGLGVFKSIVNLGVSNSPSPVSSVPIHVYPDPSTGVINISFTSPSRSSATMDLFDELGRKVKTLFNGVLEQGEKNILFDGSSLSSGTYLIVLHAGVNNYSTRITLTK